MVSRQVLLRVGSSRGCFQCIFICRVQEGSSENLNFLKNEWVLNEQMKQVTFISLCYDVCLTYLYEIMHVFHDIMYNIVY